MNSDYLFISVFMVGILLAGCLEIEVEEEEKAAITTTTISTTTTTSTLITTTTTIPTTTTTTLAKKVISCADYCKREGYEGGKCRKSPARCRIYGMNEIYKPLGDRYCPKGTGYDACCCVYPVTTTTSTTTSTTLLAQERIKVTGFKSIRPLASSVEYKSDGLFSCKILNTAGSKIEIVNVFSDKCAGVGLGSLDQLELEAGNETMLRAWCDKKEKEEIFTLNLNFTYKEFISSGVEFYHQDGGIIQGVVKNENLS